MMRGKSAAEAARLVARADGMATVAHSVAFARAVEAVSDTAVPLRGLALREVALALERVAVGLHRLDAVAGALGRGWPAVQVAREGLLEACGVAFGNRLMMDAVRPGGMMEVSGEGVAVLDAALAAVPSVERRWPAVGGLPIMAALRLGVGGVVGRASGRMDPADPAADVLSGGDLASRMALLGRAVGADVAVARARLAGLPGGEVIVAVPIGLGEGVGVAAGPLGAVWHWVRLGGGTVMEAFAADPGWLLVPALERAAEGVEAGMLAAVVASFGIGVGGLDL